MCGDAPEQEGSRRTGDLQNDDQNDKVLGFEAKEDGANECGVVHQHHDAVIVDEE
ncbi:hypothetical protein SDC9_157611 [bioreactor metagenome]|uniref:Uncharacterized protein n=1 Tax=bioreactor metagenome TaxID=1076179 RepID=A0A645F9L6_9ZZZZ